MSPSSRATAPILRAERLTRRFDDALVVDEVSLTVEEGESVALVGPSGAGKTTLLQMLGLLDHPTSGRVLLGDVDAFAAGSFERARLRLLHLGFVFQKGNLIPHLTALDNVALPAWRRCGSRDQARAEASALLTRFGLAAREGHLARKLSVGEGQRVAIARALVNRPQLILADEPTGALDSASAEVVRATFEEIRHGDGKREGTGVLVVTHDMALAARFDRVLTLRDGRLEPSAQR